MLVPRLIECKSFSVTGDQPVYVTSDGVVHPFLLEPEVMLMAAHASHGGLVEPVSFLVRIDSDS